MKKLFITGLLLTFYCFVNAQPRLVKLAEQLYGFDGKWGDSAEQLYTYNSNNLIEQTIVNYIGPYPLMPGEKHMNIYNSSGVLTTTDVFVWDQNASAWRTNAAGKRTYTYNSAVKPLVNVTTHSSGYEIDSFFYNTQGLLQTHNQWVSENGNPATRDNTESFIYNTSGVLTQSFHEFWAYRTYGQTDARVSYSYNTQGGLKEELVELWDANTSSWTTLEPWRRISNYNSDGTLKERIFQYKDGSTWNNFARDEYTYTSSTRVNDFNVDGSCTIYPNPSSGKFIVTYNFEDKTTSIKVFDIAGKIIFNSISAEGNSVEINLSGQPSGIYFMQLQSKTGIETKKIVIE